MERPNRTIQSDGSVCELEPDCVFLTATRERERDACARRLAAATAEVELLRAAGLAVVTATRGRVHGADCDEDLCRAVVQVATALAEAAPHGPGAARGA